MALRSTGTLSLARVQESEGGDVDDEWGEGGEVSLGSGSTSGKRCGRGEKSKIKLASAQTLNAGRQGDRWQRSSSATSAPAHTHTHTHTSSKGAAACTNSSRDVPTYLHAEEAMQEQGQIFDENAAAVPTAKSGAAAAAAKQTAMCHTRRTSTSATPHLASSDMKEAPCLDAPARSHHSAHSHNTSPTRGSTGIDTHIAYKAPPATFKRGVVGGKVLEAAGVGETALGGKAVDLPEVSFSGVEAGSSYASNARAWVEEAEGQEDGEDEGMGEGKSSGWEQQGSGGMEGQVYAVKKSGRKEDGEMVDMSQATVEEALSKVGAIDLKQQRITYKWDDENMYSGRLGRIKEGKKKNIKRAYSSAVWYNVSWDDNSRNQIQLQPSKCILATYEQQPHALRKKEPGSWCIDAESLLASFRQQELKFRVPVSSASLSSAAKYAKCAGKRVPTKVPKNFVLKHPVSLQAAAPILPAESKSMLSSLTAADTARPVMAAAVDAVVPPTDATGVSETAMPEPLRLLQPLSSPAATAASLEAAAAVPLENKATEGCGVGPHSELKVGVGLKNVRTVATSSTPQETHSEFPARFSKAWQGVEEIDMCYFSRVSSPRANLDPNVIGVMGSGGRGESGGCSARVGEGGILDRRRRARSGSVVSAALVQGFVHICGVNVAEKDLVEEVERFVVCVCVCVRVCLLCGVCCVCVCCVCVSK